MKRLNKSQTTTMFGDYRTARERYELGRTGIAKLAEAAGARVTIGRSVRYDLRKMDRYLEEHSAIE